MGQLRPIFQLNDKIRPRVTPRLKSAALSVKILELRRWTFSEKQLQLCIIIEPVKLKFFCPALQRLSTFDVAPVHCSNNCVSACSCFIAKVESFLANKSTIDSPENHGVACSVSHHQKSSDFLKLWLLFNRKSKLPHSFNVFIRQKMST